MALAGAGTSKAARVPLSRPHRNRERNEDDLYKGDTAAPVKSQCLDILRVLCWKGGALYDAAGNKTIGTASDGRRLAYLNALVKLLAKEDTANALHFTSEELLSCLRISLVHEATQVRAGALRAIRYVLKTEADVITFNSLRLPYLVTRCMDVVLKNEMERVQALRVIRRVLRLGSAHFEASMARALVAVPSAVPDDKDRMMRACLAALCELGVLNPQLFIRCGGVSALTRAILDCQTPRIAESLCGVLLHLLNDPRTRATARVDLRCLAAPYCDFHYRHGWMDKNRDEREMRFTCSRLSLLSILRSWPGLLHFCDPLNESGLRAIVDVLYLNQLEVRKAILDLLYELLALPQPEWTDELSVAMAAVDPSDFQDSWRLSDGFVAAEGRSILPHLSSAGPDLLELHLSLLVYCFLEVGLLDALVEVMVTSDTFISVRSTILLGQLLHLVHLLLPPESCNISPPLPTLLSRASAAHPQALAAVAALQNLNSLLKSRPASNSLFLDHVLQYCDSSLQDNADSNNCNKGIVKSKSDSSNKNVHKHQDDNFELLNDADFELEQSHRRSVGSKPEPSNKNESVLLKSKSVSSRTSVVVKSKKLFNIFDFKTSDNLIRDSNVLQNKAGFAWDWNIICAILKNGTWGTEQADLVNRLVHYLRPSANKFSHTDLQQTSPQHTHDQALAAIDLVNYLIGLQEPEGITLLTELFSDIRLQIEAISHARSAHECLFSPQHMATTMCQMYFLLIGKLCGSKKGLKIFRDTGLYESLLRLSTTTHHSCYVKLIISSLNYTLNSYPRQILAHTLQCKIESSRLYATQFLNVILRARQHATEINNRHNIQRFFNTEIIEPPSPSIEVVDTSRTWSQNNNCPADVCLDMDSWILELLVKQTRDQSKAVSLCALTILDEACNVPAYINKLVSMKPKVKDLGDKGYLLWIRFASTQIGFQSLVDAGYVHRQIRYWVKHYNYRYTRLLEGDIHDCLTLLQRSEDGRYSRRHSSAHATPRKDAPLPPHLYGQLAAHSNGIEMLATYSDIPILLQKVHEGVCSSDQEIMDLKAALWACGHIASSTEGIQLLFTFATGGSSVFADTVKLAQNCPVYSIRGTAFYVLGLMGCTYKGANILYELGWLCVRHSRRDRWPIIHEENWLLKTNSENQIFEHLYKAPSIQQKKVIIDAETSENSDKTDQSAVDSCTSDTNPNNPLPSRLMVTSVTIDHSLTEESCDSCEGELGDDKLEGSIKVKRSISESSDKQAKHIKCQTLPQRLCPTSRKHQRSLSESKTVDKLKNDEESNETVTVEKTFYIGPISENRPLVGRLNSFDQLHDSILRRIRNNSESSTSGVSSCDSVLGKYPFNDRILTLSPIPSSSSLSAMKNIIPSKRSDNSRRISLQSCTGSDVANSPPSQRDLFGYVTFRSLSRHRRPTYSEASVDELSSFLGHDTKKTGFYSLKGKSKYSDHRNARMSLLKYDWKPIGTPGPRSVKSNYSIKQTLDPMVLCAKPGAIERILSQNTSHNIVNGPCYIGISMPRNLLDLFPQKSQNLSDESSETNYVTGDDSLALDIEGPHDIIKKNDDSNFNSSFSDVSIGNCAKSSTKISRGYSRDRFSKHDQLGCLYCSRVKPVTDVRKISELRDAFFAGMDSPKASGSGSMKSGNLNKSPAPTNSMTFPSLDISCGSPNSVDSNLSKISDAHPNVTGDILKHADRMGNPFYHKQSKQALLTLKQKYPEAFQNICLYSEICKLVSQSTYRLNARRFLQELFFDLNFDLFYYEPHHILQSKVEKTESSN